MEEGSEVRMLIDGIGCGRCCEPGDYEAISENIQWFISHADKGELHEMGRLGNEYLLKHLTKDCSVRKYIEAIKAL